MTEKSASIYIQSPEQQQRLHKRTLVIVVICQLFGGAGLAAGVTVGALLAENMLGTDRYAGIPAALITFGSASGAWIIGKLSHHTGRRVGLSSGFFTGAVGAAGVVLAAVYHNLFLLFLSFLLYGVGTASNLQARYAGTDLAKPNQRAKAISFALVSTTFGAVAGPNLVDPMGRFAVNLGIPALAGPFILAATAFVLSSLVLFILLRPDPYLVAQSIAASPGSNKASPKQQHDTPIKQNRGLIVGATVMVLTQIVMIAVMTMTPVHMMHHGHGLGDVGIVISIHVGAMFLPSIITGVLVDKFGRSKMAYASGMTLLVATLLAALAPADNLTLLVTALALLGLGWNFGLISGTALIVDATTIDNRARVQGLFDVFIALAGASSGALSGMIAASTSYSTLSLIGGLLSLLLIPVMIWSRRSKR